jgi:predicted nucleic acid-binding protein
MAKHSANRQRTDYEKLTDDFWSQQRQAIGPQPMFVDTCAILACFVAQDQSIKRFLEDEVQDYRLVTSSYHVAEVARRLSKPRTLDHFHGPQGQVQIKLVLHIVQEWLIARRIIIVHIIRPVFDRAVEILDQFKYVDGWDLVDAISVAVVKGLGQNRIVSADQGFLQAGLMLAPSDASSVYSSTHWMAGT